MYIPKSFSQTDREILNAFMQAHNFATLVSQIDGQLVVTPLPLMLDTTRGEYGTLTGHLARANPHWKGLTQSEALVIFQGPHTYISPSWYETHPSVPTWNYTTIQAYGLPRIIDDAKTMTAMLGQLVDHHESGFEHPWAMDLPEDYMDKMLQAIVAFEIPITRLEGKFKLSQNRSEADQTRVISALAESSYPPDQEVSALMQAHRSSQS